MRYLVLVLVTPIFFMSELALAYASQIYGHGIAPGAQDCGYGPQPASAMYDKDFDYRELQKELKETTKELQAYSRERNRLKKRIRDHKKDSDRYLKPYAASQVVDHIENGSNELDYRGGDHSILSPACQGGSNPQGLSSEFCVNEGACLMQGNPTVSEKASMGCVEDGSNYTGVRDEWTNKYIKNMRDGFVNDAICSTRPALPKVNQQRCKNWINNFSKDAADFRTAEYEIENLKERIKDLKRDLSDRRRDIKDEIEDGTFVASEEDTEADAPCVNCSWVSKHADTIRLVAGVGLPILGAYMGYKGARSISEQNARLGWPTSPYIASNMPYPFIMQGIYGGIMGGLGAGGFGCAGGYYGGAMGPMGMGGVGGLFGAGMYGGMGGAFGYPGNLYGSPWGMGPYMPGMGPWGIPGPFGNGGFPGGGMMIGGVIGGMMGGYPAGAMMGGYPAGGMMGGAIGAMMGGYPYGGMMMGGYPAGGMMGGAIGAMMGGYPAGAMMGGYPFGGVMGGAAGAMMGGYPAGGMIGGVVGAMMGGYPAGGMMGGYPVGGMMGGYPMGGMMGGPAGGMMGGPAGGMMGGALGGMQMQQQYMQQYMQQMQQQMQYQLQAGQEYMQKQQMVGRLTQELMRIQLQIHEISSGSLYGGSTPYSVLPIQGGTSSGVGTTPTGGSGSVILGR